MLKNTGSNADQKHDKAIAELYPGDAEVYFKKGNVFFGHGDYQHAIKYFNKAMKLDHNYTDAYYNRGVSSDLIGNYPRALLNFKSAARLGNKEMQELVKREKPW